MRSPNSKVAWETILTEEEITEMPTRESPEYLPFCETVISDLNKKVTEAMESKRKDKAEKEISSLMA